MWLGTHSHRDYRSMKLLPMLLLFIAVMMITSRGGSPFSWLIFFMVVVPMLKRLFNAATSQYEGEYRRQRGDDDVVIVDKPKREPRYAIGDDGELVEVYAETDYEEKPKRRQNSDDELEYF